MPIDLDEVKKSLESMSGLSFTVIKPRYGASKDQPIENKLKLLSWPPTGGVLAKRVFKHFGLGADGKAQELCPKTFGVNNECLICNWIETAAKSQDPTMVERIKRVRQTERFLQLVIDWSHFENEKDEAKKKRLGIYDCPPKVHRQIMQEMASQDYDFTNWESALVSLVGYSQGPTMPKAIEFKVTMKNMGLQIVKLDPNEWMPLVPDLDAIYKCPTPARLQQLFEGKETAVVAEEEEVTDVGEAAKPESTMATTTTAPAAATAAPMSTPAPEPTTATPTAEPTAKPKMSLADLVKQSKNKK